MRFNRLQWENNLKEFCVEKDLGKILVCFIQKVKKKNYFLEPTDEFSVNDGFTSKLTRIKIQLVSGRGDTEPERKEVRSKVLYIFFLIFKIISYF